MKRCAVYWLPVLLFIASTAWAQEPVRSLSDLPSRLQKGDRVLVTVRDGMIIKGRFDAIAGPSLRIVASGNAVRDIPGATVTEIRKERRDPLWNGALIGAAAGVGGGLIATSTSCGSNDPECAAIAGLVFIPIFVGGGAGVGALIDKMIQKYDPVYLQQADSGRRQLRLLPVVSRDWKGVQLSFSF